MPAERVSEEACHLARPIAVAAVTAAVARDGDALAATMGRLDEFEDGRLQFWVAAYMAGHLAAQVAHILRHWAAERGEDPGELWRRVMPDWKTTEGTP